jgi:hypothetical protein
MSVFAGALVLAVAGLLTVTGASAQTSAPLVQQADLVYKGAFRVPLNTNGTSNFAYGGTGMTFNAANNSLFMTGSDPDQHTAEIKIPALVNSTSISALNTATFVQAFKDPTEGKLRQINPGDSNAQKVGGHLVYNGKLYVSGFSYYDGSGSQSSSHFVRSLSLSTAGVQGPYRIGSVSAHWVNQYMGIIPAEWRSAFGGPALAGGCCLAIISVQSNGPSAVVFDPDNLGKVSPVPGTEVLGYPYGSTDLGPGAETKNELFGLSTRIKGVAFPEGTRSVLFFGRHGLGAYCYGESAQCGDPAWPYKGTHNYPYVAQVWAYDANELVAVKNKQKAPSAVVPYAVWQMNLPFFGANDDHQIGGAAYDPSRKLIYVSQLCKDGSSCGPIIHAYEVQVGSSRPAPSPVQGVAAQ